LGGSATASADSGKAIVELGVLLVQTTQILRVLDPKAVGGHVGEVYLLVKKTQEDWNQTRFRTTLINGIFNLNNFLNLKYCRRACPPDSPTKSEHTVAELWPAGVSWDTGSEECQRISPEANVSPSTVGESGGGQIRIIRKYVNSEMEFVTHKRAEYMKNSIS